MRGILHILAHFLVPAVIAPWISKFMRPARSWWYYWAMMSATMLVDLDHFLAEPVYDPARCSLGFHPLHSFWAIGVYVLLIFPEKTLVISIGLLVHMMLDGIDCALM